MENNTTTYDSNNERVIVRTIDEVPDERLVDFCSSYLPKVSDKTGISLTVLQSISGKYQMRVVLNFYSANCSLSKINEIIGEGVYDGIVSECAALVGVEKSVIENLDEYTQEQVIGHFDMARELIPDEQLRAELSEMMNNNGKLRGAEDDKSE